MIQVLSYPYVPVYTIISQNTPMNELKWLLKEGGWCILVSCDVYFSQKYAHLLWAHMQLV